MKKIIKYIMANPHLVKRFIREVRYQGIRVAICRAKNKLNQLGQLRLFESDKSETCLNSVVVSSYQSWLDVNHLSENRKQYLEYNLSKCTYKPLISIIIPVYNPLLEFFIKAIDSVQKQIYSNFEICIVDDCSSNSFIKPYLSNLQSKYNNVKISYNTKNLHISESTNNAVKIAKGEYLVFLDQDDELTHDALAEIVLYLNKCSECELLYSDDDKIDVKGNLFAPQFKPEWSPEYLLSFMYCGHLKCVSKRLYESIGGFRKGFEGAQDYDFYLRASERVKHIGHIPRILYHWRVIPGSTASGGNEKSYSFEAGRKALEEALKRRNIIGEAYQPKWALANGNGIYDIKFPDEGKDVAIIIPTKNNYNLIKSCVESLKKTTYKNYKIYIVDNDSDDDKTINYLNDFRDGDVLRIPSKNGKFSFSYINNEAVKNVKEELVLFLNDDVEVITPNWLSQMVGYLQFTNVGSVGAKLLFPDNRIQHAGILHGMTHGLPITSNRLLAKWEWGYLASAVTSKNFLAVTAACMLTPRSLFEELGGFDDTDFQVAFNDCDYGYRLYKHGYRNVLSPNSILYHHEGVSRGYSDNPREESNYIRKYLSMIDPYYNSNLAKNCSDYSIASNSVVLHEIPKFRVLMVTHNLNLEGAPKSFYEIVSGIKNKGLIEPIVLSHKDGPLMELYKQKGIRVIIADNFNLFSLTKEKQIQDFIKLKSKLIKELGVDLIYGNTIEAFWAICCAKLLNLPSVWNIRESEDPFSSYNHNPKMKKSMIDAIKYPYKVIFVADATRRVYQRLNSQNNFITIYNGFDEELAISKTKELDRRSLRKFFEIKGDELVVLILGTVCDRKGQQDLVKAIELMDDNLVKKLKFFIVGDRESLDYSKQMHKIINSFSDSIKSRITVVEETPEIHKYYIISDIFVCCSRVESFPKVIQEAMYYKLAIITTPVYGIVEQVKDQVSALYYNPGNIKELLVAIEKLTNNDKLRNELALNAKVALESFPSIDEMASQYLEVFKQAWLSGQSR